MQDLTLPCFAVLQAHKIAVVSCYFHSNRERLLNALPFSTGFQLALKVKAQRRAKVISWDFGVRMG